MPHRILQITDCHLFADRRDLRGIATWPRFTAVLSEIRNRFADFDCLVVSGDTAHDEIEETYAAFREALGELAEKLLLIPGNHDNREAIVKVFPDRCELTDGRLTFQHCLDGWQLIGLDSHIPGEVAGCLGQEQLSQLRKSLAAANADNTLVFVHHPPVPMRSRWLDEIGLGDTDGLMEVLKEFPSVRLVCSGHVHQESTTATRGPVVLTTPAVGPQFRPRTDDIEIDPLPPALRVIDLEPDGPWVTQVVRVQVD